MQDRQTIIQTNRAKLKQKKQGDSGFLGTASNAEIRQSADKRKADTGILGTASNEQIKENIANRSTEWMDGGVQKPQLGPATVISPTLQAKIDAKKTPKPVETPIVPETTPVVTPATVTPEPVKTVNVVSYKDNPDGTTTNTLSDGTTSIVTNKMNTDGTMTQTEVSDVEKQAQATGIPYTMQNGQPVYNATSKDEAVKVLQMGGKLAGDTRMNAVAQANLNKVRGFAQMTDQQLANNISLGKVSSKEMELLNQINPNLVAKAQEFSKKKVITNTTNEVQAVNNAIINGGEYDGVSTPLKELLTKLATIDADQRTPAEMKAQYEADHPEMVTARDTINTLQTQKREIERAKRDLWDEYKAKNSSMPIQMILAGYNIASKSLDDQMYSINDNLNTEISNYNSYLDEMNAEMDWEIAQQGKQEERLWNIYGVTSAEQIRQEDIQREDARIEQSIQLEEARYQRDIEREDFKSAEARLQKIEDMKMDMNMNIETGLLNLGVNPTGMTPEEMRSSYAKATKSQIDAQTRLDYAKITKKADAGDGTPAPQFTPVFNEDGTMKISESSVYNLAIGQDGNSVQVQGVEEGGYAPNGRVECGAFVNDIIGVKIFGNKLSDKTKNINSTEPVVGGAFIEDVGPYGHVGFIESINEDGSINIIDSNYSKDTDGKIRRDTIAVGSPRWNQIKGFYDPSVGGAKPLDSNQRIIANSEKSAFRSNPVVKAFEEGLQQYKDIVVSLNDESGPGDTAGIFQFMKSLDPTSVVRESEFDAAAKSAGVFEYIGNTYDRVMKGKKLSPEQAIAFKRLAKAYVANRAESYNRLYDDMARSLDNQGIHQSYFPTRATDDLLGGGEFQPTKTDTKEEEQAFLDLQKQVVNPGTPNIGGGGVNIQRGMSGLTFN